MFCNNSVALHIVFMQILKIKRVHTILVIYWILLTYIIAALIWWCIALNQQNRIMAFDKIKGVRIDQPNYQAEVAKINQEKDRKTAQYIGEGLTFFSLLIIGAVFVFRAVRRQFRQSMQQRHFMMAITHELKTPIAVTKLNLETLQKYRLTEEQQEKLIRNTIQETNRLNDLCNNMLLATQIESDGYKLTNEQINLTEVVAGCAHDFIIRYPKRNIRINLKEGVSYTGDMLLLQMAVNNVMDNALKYSAKETPVFITLENDKGKILLTIKDEGKGIPDPEKEKIFLKYYRAGKNTLDAKGTGLGLFLTRKIVQQHKGKIIVTDNIPQGSNFTIVLNSE